MHALLLAVALAGPAQCPGCDRPTELNFSVRSGYAAPARYERPAYFVPAYERPRTRLFYYEDTRRGLLPWRYSRQRYYYFDGR